MPETTRTRIPGAAAAFCLLVAAIPAPQAGPGRTVLSGGNPAKIPLDLSNGRPMVEATINGEGPFRFVLDTGASVTVIDNTIAERLGLEVVGHQRIGGPGAADGGVPANQLRVDRIELSGVTIEQAVVLGIDLRSMAGDLFDGVLGMPHFADYLVTFDYPRATARVERGRLDPAADNVVPLLAGAGDLRIEVDVAGVALPVTIDTGSPGGFSLPKAMEGRWSFLEGPEEAGVARLVGAESKFWRGRIDGTIAVAGNDFPAPVVNLAEYGRDFGNLGAGVLSRAEMTIDQAAGLVRLVMVEPAAAPVAAAPAGPQRRVVAAGSGPRLGVGFQMTPAGFVLQDGGIPVNFVESGGTAEAAGIRTGDRILAVNETAAADIAGQAALAALLGVRPLRLKVAREGAIREVVIQ